METGRRSIETRIAVIDDEPDGARLLSAVLGVAGAKNVTTFSGAEAPEQAWKAVREGTRFDIAVVDVAMPKMDGYDLSVRMKGVLPRLKIVVVSAMPGYLEAARFLGGGEKALAVRYFEKPVPLMQFVDAVRSLAHPEKHGFSLLGTMLTGASGNGNPVTIQLSRQQATVLEIIMMADTPIPMPKIVEEMEAREGKTLAFQTVRTHLARTRDHIEGSTPLRIIHDGHGYSVVVE